MRLERGEFIIGYGQHVAISRITANGNVIGELLERGNPLGLETLELGPEIPVDLGVPRCVAVGVAQNVGREKVLGVATSARSHRQQHNIGSLGDSSGHPFRDDFNLGRKAPAPSSVLTWLYTSMAVSAVLPTALKPPVHVRFDGIRPVCPQTGMPSAVSLATISVEAAQ